MNVRNCRGCGKVFNYVMGPFLCPRCRDEQEVIFQGVKKYVEEHRGADIMEVSVACEVDPGQIRQWIREDRLQFADDSPIRIPCEKCGVMIQSGRYCEACKAEMVGGFKQAMRRNIPQPTQQNSSRRMSDKDRMRYL